MGFAGMTEGVPNDSTARVSACVHASTTFGTL